MACSLALLTYIHRLGSVAAAPQIKNGLGLSDEYMSYLMSAFLVAYAFFQIPDGLLGDSFGARQLLTFVVLDLSVLTGAVALVAYLPAAGLLPFAVLFVLHGIVECPQLPEHRDHLTQRRKPAVNQNSSTKATPTPLDIAVPLVGSLDQAIGEATTVMGAMVTELMRRSLRGGVLKIGEQLETYVGECVGQTIAERLPFIEQTASAVAEQTAYSTAAKLVGEEVYALEQRTAEAGRALAGQIEEAERRTREAAEEKARGLSAEIAQRVKAIMDRAKEGTARIKASIQAVADLTAELGKRLDAERQARQTEHAAVRDLERNLTDELRELRRTNDEMSARVAGLERPRGLRRLCCWVVGLFRRGKR